MTTISENIGLAPTETHSALPVWQHETFASHFRSVLQERVNRAVVNGDTQEDIARCAEAVEIVDRAIQVKNMDLIVTCHQYIINATIPAAVDVAYHVMKPMLTDRKVCSAIKKEHIAFCEKIIPMFPFEFGMSTDECYAVIGLGFEDISKADAIIEFLTQGVTDEDSLRAHLTPRHVTGKLPLR